jgi:hypothetical protein
MSEYGSESLVKLFKIDAIKTGESESKDRPPLDATDPDELQVLVAEG